MIDILIFSSVFVILLSEHLMVDLQQDNNNKNLVDYCNKFASLNARTNYQPTLLLTIIDLIAQNIIKENRILLSKEFLNTVLENWRRLNPESKKISRLQDPFISLYHQKILHLKFKPGIEQQQLTTINNSINKLKDAVEYVSLDDKLFELLQNQENRRILFNIIIDTYFSKSQQQLENFLNLDDDYFQEVNEKKLGESNSQIKKKYSSSQSLLRDFYFRKKVIHIYDYRCSLCHLKVIKLFTQNIVEAAHIKPFAKFYDNRINNGLSLCQNHHWAFDQGIFSIDDNYKIIVNDNFSEESPNMKPIRDFQGEMILLPDVEKYLPNLECIQWHRNNIFRK